MKKSLLIVLLAFFSFTISKAQDVQWGVKGGLNVATLGKSELGYLPRMAFHLGGSAEFITTPFFSVQVELLYSLQGAAIDRSQNIYLNYHYLNLPVFAKLYFYEDASFEIGLQYGYMVKAANKNFYNSSNQSEDVNRNDFSGVFGLSYKLNEAFTFGLRYNLGITNTSKQDIIYEQRYTNRVLMISIGYVF